MQFNAAATLTDDPVRSQEKLVGPPLQLVQ